MKAEILGRKGLKTVSLNRRRAIREKCLDCSCWVSPDVRRCGFRECALHPYREGKGKQNPKERDRALRAYCLWCMAGQRAEVPRCVSIHCALYHYRTTGVRKSKPLSGKGHGGAISEAIST